MRAILVGVFASFAICMAMSLDAAALKGAVISQVQTGDMASATNEAVEIYNNSDTDQDITNWCIRYATATSATVASSPKYCFMPIDAETKIFLSSQSYASIVTPDYVMLGSLFPDGRFANSGFAAAGGHIKLLDQAETVIDVVGWGTAIFAEGYIAAVNPAPTAPSTSQALLRKTLSGAQLQDTDNNRADFELKIPGLRSGGTYEVRTVIDLCGNLADVQEAMPSEYDYDEAGNCELLSADQCLNIAFIQVTMPDTLMRDSEGGCFVDTCPNIDGLQSAVPNGFVQQGDFCVEQERRELWLSEILPNVSGSDAGYEFVEIYNPNDDVISLAGYILQVGKNLEASYSLGTGAVTSIPGHGFVTFYDSELGFALLNTTNALRLVAPAGNIVSETSYSEPKDDQSWALLDVLWQYTNQVTPNAANLAAMVLGEETESSTTSPTPCPAGKYRHPITNRCRNIESDAAMLAACDADEYRNLETNRCRKIASLASTLVPCNDGYARNPETNRCRKIGDSSTSLTPCQTGYERNPATNRCRKSGSLLAPASSPATATQSTDGSMLKNALIITAGVGVAGYGLYEWRSELFRGLRRLAQLISGK